MIWVAQSLSQNEETCHEAANLPNPRNPSHNEKEYKHIYMNLERLKIVTRRDKSCARLEGWPDRRKVQIGQGEHHASDSGCLVIQTLSLMRRLSWQEHNAAFGKLQGDQLRIVPVRTVDIWLSIPDGTRT